MPKVLANLFPPFPRTPHLPFQMNAGEGDLVGLESEVGFLFTSPSLVIEEKIDGANCGMLWDGSNAVLRNRDHIMKKGYLKDTPSKAQFRPAWNWFYDHVVQFERLNHRFHGPVGVYGEWLYALHGIEYTALPSHFVAFDIYDVSGGYCIATPRARKELQDAGFVCPPLLHEGPISDWSQLVAFCNDPSAWSTERREGVYVKDSECGIVTQRYKMVRSDFRQGCRWSPDHIVKQKVV